MQLSRLANRVVSWKGFGDFFFFCFVAMLGNPTLHDSNWFPFLLAADILRPLCPCKLAIIQKFLACLFHKTSLWRMGLHFCYAEQCLKLQGFVSQYHLPCNCNFCLLPLLESVMYKETIKYSKENQYCPICTSHLFWSAEPFSYFAT